MMTSSERWVLGLGAIYADGAGLDQLVMGGTGGDDAQRAQSWLRENLSIADKGECDDLLEEINESFVDAEETASSGFYAMEGVGTARVAVVAGWLGKDRFWQYVLPMARRVRREFSGWRELAEAWLSHRASEDEFEDWESRTIDWLLGSSHSIWAVTPWDSFIQDDHSYIHAVALTTLVYCPHCAGTTPAGGVYSSLTCGDCLGTISIGKAAWRFAFGTRVESVLYRPLGAVDICFSHDPTLRYDSIARRQLLKCTGCQANVPLTSLQKAVAKGGWSCECGQKISLREPDKLAKGCLKGLVALVGEVPPLRVENRSTETALVPCHGCGAPLKVTGDSRKIRCEYCSDTTELPDAIWRRLVPLSPIQEFYVLVDTNEHDFAEEDDS